MAKHHYLPQFYLKGFTDGQGEFMIWSVKERRFKGGGKWSTGAGSGVTKTTLAILPEFIFGYYRLKQVPVNLENPAEHDPGTGVLGMDIMKRFNTVLDYRNNLIWLKSNALVKNPFKQIDTQKDRERHNKK